MRAASLLLVVLGILAFPTGASAAEPEAASGVRRGEKFVGEPFGVFVRAEGFEEEPQPECVPGALPKGVTLRLLGVRPQVSSFVHMFNGQRTQERKVTFTYEFEAFVSRPGAVQFQPFTVKQGSKEAKTQGLLVPIQTVPVDQNMSIALEIPPGPHAPGERVPVTIVWSFAGELSSARSVTIRSEFFDAFDFEDEDATAQDLLVPLVTKDGVIKIKGSVKEVDVKSGAPGIEIRATRTWRVKKPGTFEFPPITVQLQRVTRWQRSFFGDREPAAARRVRATGEPVTVTVEALPTEGLPKSFAGAVGRGFSLEVSADRTVVRAGDPIRLTLTLRGDGNLGDAGLPTLTNGGGLDPRDFRQADAEATGQVADDAKVFEVTVRVENDRVARIPPIEYGWWNPQARKYETTQSKPIALQVGEAKIVSADDVVSAEPATGTSSNTGGTSAAPTAAQIVSGADLALVEDLDQLRKQPAGPWLPVLLYGLGALALAAAFVQRRRAQVDPAIRQRTQAASRASGAIAKARQMSALEGAKHAAESLRSLRAAYPDAPRPATYDDVLSRLDAIAYRPATDTTGIPPDLLAAAQAAAQEIGS